MMGGFPSASFTSPEYGIRGADLITTTGKWTVPSGVNSIKVMLYGGGGNGTTAGGTSTFGNGLITCTGGGSADGTAATSNTLPGPVIGAFPMFKNSAGTVTYGLGVTSNGGGIIKIITNLSPGEIFQVTIGAAGGNANAGCCYIEY